MCAARCRDPESVSWRNERKVPEQSGSQGLCGPELGAFPQSRASVSTPHVPLSPVRPHPAPSPAGLRPPPLPLPRAHALVSALLQDVPNQPSFLTERSAVLPTRSR